MPISDFPEYDKPLEEPLIDPIETLIGSGVLSKLLRTAAKQKAKDKMTQFAARALAKKLENRELTDQGMEAFKDLNENLYKYKKNQLSPNELVNFEKQFIPKTPEDMEEFTTSSPETRQFILDKIKKMREITPEDADIIENPILKSTEEITKPINIESFHKFKQLKKALNKTRKVGNE